MPPGTLIVRADASVAMGTGHVMRCLALAQAWQDQGGSCIFAMAEAGPVLQERMRSEGIEVVTITASAGSQQDAAELREAACTYQASWLVVDGYQFDVEYQRALKAAGVNLLVIDDTGHAGAYVADLVLDQNSHATDDLYRRREPYTRLLLGSRYAMLRREFKPWRGRKREIADVGRKVLVTMGGTDPDNVTVRVMHALRLLAEDTLEATIVVGGSNPHGNELEEAVDRAEGAIRLRRNALNMPELMADADAAISAAGTTCWEMCLLGLPAIIIDVADNQRPVAQELNRLGIAIHAGGVQDTTSEAIASQLKQILASSELRTEMSKRGQELVDGQGADRVVSAMWPVAIRLRPAERNDCRLLWQWANDSGSRATAFSPETIPWAQHEAWFDGKMKDPNCLILIGENREGKPVGQIRLDLRSSREGEIDVSVSPDSRGIGLGTRLIDLGVREAFVRTEVECVHAFIRPENQASIRAFERANFLSLGEDVVKLQPALHYCRTRNSKPK
jgi:UDP-2,4-diacetamido-2,4,6-trideoxy-beta-L-altropyranose hydrolase